MKYPVVMLALAGLEGALCKVLARNEMSDVTNGSRPLY